ncbi:YraN family protein [Flavobacterium selenitireducens]|uniref:YraN family protein n=1 Tax=Flavobacterium selenitireducens TaxID=2722704 RepID=UPI00168AF76C|nr:YraN family protein [Flavobacterium selenitireducens]MBD3581701.1 endonuclease [Flavobacterium selenitireducens]
MATHNDLGKHGEKLAVAYLKKLGHEILQTNYVSGKAEIDIISRVGNYLCVVEVKTRSSGVFGLPQEFVSAKKIRLLQNAVNEFVERYDVDCEVRFDIVALIKKGSGFEIEYLPNAFYYF